MRSPIIFFLLILKYSVALNILMYAMIGGQSHERFADKLITILSENGHTVDVIMGMVNSHATLKESYATRNLVTVAFPGDKDWGSVNPLLLNPFQEQTDWTRLKSLHSNTFMDTVGAFCDALLDSSEVKEMLTSNNYDLGLISGYDLCPFALAHQYKISPVVSYVAVALYPTQYYFAGLPELPLYENSVFFESYENRLTFTRRVLETLRTLRDRYVHGKAQGTITEKFRKRFGVDFPDVREIGKQISFDFSNSHPLLEEPVPTSLRIKFIGGIGRSSPKPLSEELDSLLNLSKKGTVIFSFGTQITPEKFSEDLKRVFVNTFKRFPDYNFLWKFDGKTPMNATNIYNMEWLPQTDLLHDSRVVAFISHMGLNSFTETAFAGVPVVAIPLFADQVHNAKRARTLGIGEIVRNSEITEENLYHALEKVLHDARSNMNKHRRYRNRAREIAEMIAAQPETPQRTFLEGIEYAAKFQNLSFHYRLAGADYHHLVQIGWDTAIFWTLVVLCLIYLASTFVIFVCRRLVEKMQMKRKHD